MEGKSASYATEASVEKVRSDLIKWVIGTGLTSVGIAVAIAIFIQSLIG